MPLCYAKYVQVGGALSGPIFEQMEKFPQVPVSDHSIWGPACTITKFFMGSLKRDSRTRFCIPLFLHYSNQSRPVIKMIKNFANDLEFREL